MFLFMAIMVIKTNEVVKIDVEVSAIMNEQKAIREAKNAYMREWRRKNPEKARENQRRYWAKKAKQMAEQADRGGE